MPYRIVCISSLIYCILSSYCLHKETCHHGLNCFHKRVNTAVSAPCRATCETTSAGLHRLWHNQRGLPNFRDRSGGICTLLATQLLWPAGIQIDGKCVGFRRNFWNFLMGLDFLNPTRHRCSLCRKRGIGRKKHFYHPDENFPHTLPLCGVVMM